ncbi:MotA/TolQ/ExbB proton channel family protein [Rhodoferax sp. AJA081-3]|uniref:MotA/TolQ/ExbB proton channel family protein n=1 Tax=Rhodoferax sp. AJA081-3 TaxID=2752316 RepID=UPI001AE02A3C|nr:MotA/TolQ/ExbB proton channel family protein [Rhodoferax sp. AJA081-3]QTN26531.1 MotA/TolQ/ExbB proton channel family protein [Rhodoferax sp. AJA081-3]
MIVHTKFKVLVRAWALTLSLAVVSVAGVSTSAMAQTAAPASTAVAADPAAAPAAPAAEVKKAEGTTDNPYGIAALWHNAHSVDMGVLIILAIMSMGSWYILAIKMLEQRKAGKFAREATEKFWSAGTVAQGAAALHKDSPYQFIAAAGVEATKKHGGLMGHIPLNDWISMSIQRSVDRVNREMQGGLSFLATVGSISPFVGLFGTVWGIYGALTQIGMSGQASIDKVAGPVGSALIMTALGLAVAVPAVLAYNWLIARNKTVMDDVRSFGSDLHSVLLGSASKS